MARSLFSLLFLTCLVSLLAIAASSSFATAKLLQVHVISRHCDRTPTASGQIPTDPVDWQKTLNLPDGQLTGLGMNQCFTMGQGLRQRYIDVEAPTRVAGISAKYDPRHYYFSSTDMPRTVISLWSASMGLFPENGPALDWNQNTTAALPHATAPVPIMTIPLLEDTLFRGFTIMPGKSFGPACPAQDALITAWKQSPEYAALVEKHQPFIDQTAVTAAGFPKGKFTFGNYYDFMDLVIVQKSHGLLKNQALLDNYDKIVDIGSQSLNALAGTRRSVGKFTGEVLKTVLLNMNEAIAASSKSHNFVRYIHWSAHDTSIMSILATLALEERPVPYGSQLIFELHEDATLGKFVTVIFRSGFDGEFKALRLEKLGKGCDENCPLERFESNVLTDGIVADWCVACGTDNSTSKCTADALVRQTRLLEEKNNINHVFTIVTPILAASNVLLIVILAGTIVYFVINSRRKQQDFGGESKGLLQAIQI